MSLFSSVPILKRTGGSVFIASSPFRTNYFLSNTILLLFIIIGLVGEIMHCWQRLPALSCFLLGGVIFGLLGIWNTVFRTHREIQRLLASESVAYPEPGSLADMALGAVAGLSFHALFTASSPVMLCAMAMYEAICNH